MLLVTTFYPPDNYYQKICSTTQYFTGEKVILTCGLSKLSGNLLKKFFNFETNRFSNYTWNSFQRVENNYITYLRNSRSLRA